MWNATTCSFPTVRWDLDLGNRASRFHFQSNLQLWVFFSPRQLAHLITASASQQNHPGHIRLPSAYELRFILLAGRSRHVSFSTSIFHSQSLMPEEQYCLFLCERLALAGRRTKVYKSLAVDAHHSFVVHVRKEFPVPRSGKGEFFRQKQLHRGCIIHNQHSPFLTYLCPTLPGRHLRGTSAHLGTYLYPVRCAQGYLGCQEEKGQPSNVKTSRNTKSHPLKGS